MHCIHVALAHSFRSLVARKTHSYYAVQLDGCVPVSGSAQTVLGFVPDPCTENYSPLLTRDDFCPTVRQSIRIRR